MTFKWIPAGSPPKKRGKYLVHAKTLDPKLPLYWVAWYEPAGVRGLVGWQLMPIPFIPSITHWAEIPSPEEPHDA